jgi:phospholipase C
VEVRGRHRRERGGQLRLTLTNRGAQAVRLTVTANAYPRLPARHHTLAPGASLDDTWAVAQAGGWYDLSVTAASSTRFLCRLAGRVETGRPRTSDPATA